MNFSLPVERSLSAYAFVLKGEEVKLKHSEWKMSLW